MKFTFHSHHKNDVNQRIKMCITIKLLFKISIFPICHFPISRQSLKNY